MAQTQHSGDSRGDDSPVYAGGYAQTPYSQSPSMQQPAYGQAYRTQQQYAGATYGTAVPTVMDTQSTYSYERARRVSVTRAYAEMTVGLAVTAVVAVLTQMTGALESFLATTGSLGWIGLAIVQVVMAVALGARVMSMRPATARVVFYLYAALMGFTLSSIFYVYDLGSIGLTLGLCVGFFFALTMLALTTKKDMLKAGPILLVALLVLIVGETILMFTSPSDSTLMAVSAIGLLIFAGLTAYDAQKTRALFASYAGSPEAVERLSILCALNLYLDFVNMFLYLLRLIGSRN